MWCFYGMTAAMAACTVWALVGKWRPEHKNAAHLLLVLVPCLSIGAYLFLGSPDMPSMPARDRGKAVAGQDSDNVLRLLARRPLEKLTRDKNDLGALESLAEINLRAGKPEEAVLFYARAEKAARKAGDVRADVYWEKIKALAPYPQ